MQEKSNHSEEATLEKHIRNSSRNALPGSAGDSPARITDPSPFAEQPPHKGWHTRGYLPHFDTSRRAQFITFRLEGALPAHIVHRWRAMLGHLPREKTEYELRLRIEDYLDKGYGPCFLKESAVAEVVQNTMLRFDARRYHLHEWVIMPNHVHVLITPEHGYSLSDIMHSLKSFTGKKANQLLGRKGRFWQVDYFDRYIRDEKHFSQVVKYIRMNPVKAGLCDSMEHWMFSSAHAARC